MVRIIISCLLLTLIFTQIVTGVDNNTAVHLEFNAAMNADAPNLMDIYENQIGNLKNMEEQLNISLKNINSTIMSQYKKILDSIPNSNDKINCSIIPNDLIANAQKMAFDSDNCLTKPLTAFNDFFAYGVWSSSLNSTFVKCSMQKPSFQQILKCIDKSTGGTYNYTSINDFFHSKSNDLTLFMNECQGNLTTMLRDTLTSAKNKLQLCIDAKKLQKKLPTNLMMSTLQPVLDLTDPASNILGQNGQKSLVNTTLNNVGNLLTKIISALNGTILNNILPELQNILQGIDYCLADLPQINSLLNIPKNLLDIDFLQKSALDPLISMLNKCLTNLISKLNTSLNKIMSQSSPIADKVTPKMGDNFLRSMIMKPENEKNLMTLYNNEKELLKIWEFQQLQKMHDFRWNELNVDGDININSSASLQNNNTCCLNNSESLISTATDMILNKTSQCFNMPLSALKKLFSNASMESSGNYSVDSNICNLDEILSENKACLDLNFINITLHAAVKHGILKSNDLSSSSINDCMKDATDALQHNINCVKKIYTECMNSKLCLSNDLSSCDKDSSNSIKLPQIGRPSFLPRLV